MAGSRIGGTETHSLGALGISESEERAYRWLLAHSGATARDLAQALSLSPRKAQQLLEAIESKGLTTHSPERPRRYLPSSPDMALRALFLRQQEALLGTQLAIQELQEKVSEEQRRGEEEQVVELITSHEVERQLFEQLSTSAEGEILTLLRLPMLISRLNAPAEDRVPQHKAQARGVHYRTIVDEAFLKEPGAVQFTREDMKLGEEVRVISQLPFKMVLADRRIALIPLNLQRPDSPALLVRSSTLLDALHALFELLWERASPISLSRENKLQIGRPDSQLNEQARELISLMAAGLNDKRMSYELGITIRTLQRRVTELMQTLGARTRFQVGWLAALHLAAAGAIPGVKIQPQK